MAQSAATDLGKFNNGVNKMTTVKLGDRARDIISGYEGIVTGISDYLIGCKHVQLAPEKLDEKGDRRDAHWFDEPQVALVEAGVHSPEKLIGDAPATKRGGPSLYGYSR